MHGAANDFILVDDRAQTFPVADAAWIAAIAARRTGVGCEGVLLIQPSNTADFRMRFFNPDGGEVEMCGNGARCIARLARDLGIASARMTIETAVGRLGAEVLAGGRVRIAMTPPRDWRLHQHIFIDPRWIDYHFVNTGVPHVVIPTEDLEAADVAAVGRAVRRHPEFQPAGTNVNFVRVTGPSSLAVRTYERGVEAETLACGTGLTASALVMARLGQISLPVTVVPASGDTLVVDAAARGDAGYEDVTLTGPAVYVFRGELVYLSRGPAAPAGGVAEAGAP